jgi:DNA repair exonuclease SbcCD ATPase subunit
MTENPETTRLLMAAIERIDGKLEALDNKVERKMDQLNQKLDVNLRELQGEIHNLRDRYNKLDVTCQSKTCRSEELEQELRDVISQVVTLKSEIAVLKNNEWKLFFRQLGKAAAYIVGIGTAIVLLQQIFGSGGLSRQSPSYQSAPAAGPTPPPYLTFPFSPQKP